MLLGDNFIGRCDEVDALDQQLALLGRSMGSLLVISGNAGIGKTALAREFCDRAAKSGANTLWSSFPEHADSPPYWGWIQICRKIAAAGGLANAHQLAEAMERSHPESLTEPSPRFQVRLAQVLHDFSATRPLVLFFDDIQHSDCASDWLLGEIANELPGLPVLLVATFRDGESNLGVTNRTKVPRLALHAQAQRIVLRGMDELECSDFCRELCGWSPEARIARSLHRQTEGNPLFLRQIVQTLVDQGYIANGKADLPPFLTVPDGITEAIGSRLERVSASCLQCLDVAAILGREFDFATLERLAEENLPENLDEATTHGLVRPVDEIAGKWQFAHALIREVIYDRIPPMRRLKAHADASSAIEAVHGTESPIALTAMAYHAFAGQVFAGSQRVIDLSCRSAEHAMSVAAYEDAGRQFRIALECFSIPGVNDPHRRIDVALALARAEHLCGDNLAAIATAREAVSWARKLEDWPRFAAGALCYEEARWQPGLPSNEVLEFLLIGLAHAQDIDEKTAIRLRYCYARALQQSGELQAARIEAHAAIDHARRVADDALLCEAISQGTQSYCSLPGTLGQRLELSREALLIARQLADRQSLSTVLVDLGVCHANAGNIVTFSAIHDELKMLAHELGQPHLKFVCDQFAFALAFIDGSFEQAATLAMSSLQKGRKLAGTNPDGIYGIQMFLLQRERGMLGQVAEVAARIGTGHGFKLWRPGYLLLLAETGQMEQARHLLAEIAADGVDTVPCDDTRQLTFAFLADAIWLTDSTLLAQQVFERMKIETGNAVICGPAAVFYGPVDRSLALLKASMQLYDEARTLFERALEQARGWNSLPMMARIACDFSEALIREGTLGAIKRAKELEHEFALRAADAGLRALATRFAGISSQLRSLASSHGFDQLTAREVEVLRALAVGASNADISRELGISLPTVATHVRSILSKTDSKNRTAAAAYARHVGLVGMETST